MEATLDKFGRIVIPKKIREDFNLRPGSPIRIEEKKNEILLIPIEGEPTLIEKKVSVKSVVNLQYRKLV